MELVITMFWGWLSSVEPALNALTLAGVAFAVYQFGCDRTRGRNRITVVLVCGDQRATLPLHLRRSDVSRAEVLGRLGMVPMREKSKRFALAFLASPEFLQGINSVVDGKSATLEILCSGEEFAQFDL